MLINIFTGIPSTVFNVVPCESTCISFFLSDRKMVTALYIYRIYSIIDH